MTQRDVFPDQDKSSEAQPKQDEAADLALRLTNLDHEGRKGEADALIPRICALLQGESELWRSNLLRLLKTGVPEIIDALPVLNRSHPYGFGTLDWRAMLDGPRPFSADMVAGLRRHGVSLGNARHGLAHKAVIDPSFEDVFVSVMVEDRDYFEHLLTFTEFEYVINQRPDLVERIAHTFVETFSDDEIVRTAKSISMRLNGWAFGVLYLAYPQNNFCEESFITSSPLVIACQTANSAHARLKVLDVLGPLDQFIRATPAEIKSINQEFDLMQGRQPL